MDWDNQPNPFRLYEGAVQTPLPFGAQDPDLSYPQLYTPVQGQGVPLTLSVVGAFCELSLGLSAWKQAGTSRWSLRINPSSGNLHPTEGYLVLPELPELAAGVFHYAPIVHALEHRAQLDKAHWAAIQDHFGGPGFGVALTAIVWRESWKYGERAYRYCNLDAGHALAALAFAARLHNWHCCLITGAGDDQIRTLLGLDRTLGEPLEQEAPEMFCWVATQPPGQVPQTLPDQLVRPLATRSFSGRPNRLSRQAADWPIIDQAAAASHKPVTVPQPVALVQGPVNRVQPKQESAAGVIRRRRSAVDFDPRGYISADTFWAILDPTLARADIPPFGAALMAPAVHLLLFVHRVNDLAQGLYLLARGAQAPARLRGLWRSDFQWQPVAADLPLYLLLQGDVTVQAMALSCHQQIAGQSAFAVAMLAPFDAHLQQAPYAYRHLHWECGMLGQVLYLGAEAHGLRGTGIGCFFDDEVHQLLGINDSSFQSLYHFTVGHAMEDDRLTTLPGYHHLATS
jgi:SagB-type dehydrogenase family enzyme